MNKLDAAITHFKNRGLAATVPSVINDSKMVADALEEIRDLLTADKQSNTENQPATFEPWHDVVEIVGPAAEPNGHRHIGLEGFVVDETVEEDGLYKVSLGDYEDVETAWFPASSLRLVRRLKPRAQAPQPYVGSVMTDGGKEPTNEDLLRAAGYEQRQPVFKVGEYVQNGYGDIFEVMSDSYGSRVQVRNVDDTTAYALKVGDVARINKPAPFQVGDWVRTPYGGEFQIAQLSMRFAYDVQGYGKDISTLTKIDPPAPRFTFGDRVRVDHGEIPHIFLSYSPAGMWGNVVDADLQIHSIDIQHLTLDTAAD